jgi:hypothetical protein
LRSNFGFRLDGRSYVFLRETRVSASCFSIRPGERPNGIVVYRRLPMIARPALLRCCAAFRVCFTRMTTNAAMAPMNPPKMNASKRRSYDSGPAHEPTERDASPPRRKDNDLCIPATQT